MNTAIIIPAYSRADSLKRLLNSINSAVYPSTDIKLIISLDGGYSKEVLTIADEFNFRHGQTSVIKRKSNIGLREHILWCGDQTNIFESVIILEDDLFVDRYFYYFAIEALKYYENENRVAGISLYGHKYNEYAQLPFEPINNGSSAYFMKIAASWGQAWTKKHWEGFRNWYNDNSGTLDDKIKLPEQIFKYWPDSSWKKYYSAYLVVKDKYFLYPHNSYTTNFADVGGKHVKLGTNLHQVPLSLDNREYLENQFPAFNDSAIYYDSFMEPEYKDIFEATNFSKEQLEIDLFGIKKTELLRKKKFCLTSKPCESPIQRYGLNFRPIENNILFKNTINNQHAPQGRKCLNLALSENVIQNQQSYFTLAQFYSYVNFKSIIFLTSYLKFIFSRIARKLLLRK